MIEASSMGESSDRSAAAGPPLVVDLDGTLVRSDLLIETAFAELGHKPSSGFAMIRALMRTKAALKHVVAERAAFDAATLPYDPVVLAYIRRAAEAGRPIYLASASNQRLVKAVADHLGLFTGWFASDEVNNLSGERKAQRLVAEFGERGFDYIGNDAADVPVWSRAGKAIAIRTSAGVARRLAQCAKDIEYLPDERPTWRTWARLLRVHQYAKNALIFVPLLTSHQFSLDSVSRAFLSFVAFSLCASSVYILNDLADLQADRGHRSKRRRPLASGAIPLIHAIYAVPLLFVSSVLIAIYVSPGFLAVLLGYFALTVAYSFILKRKMLVDVVALAVLYATRVVGGAMAIGAVVSEWLLAFSMFIFASLALIKRYVELAGRADADMQDPSNRNYKIGDLGIVGALAAAAGLNAVVVFQLYIASTAASGLYRRPQVLWLISPILMYWISRALLMAHRRHLDDDPIVFALRDRNSLIAGAMIVALILAAI